ncbi:MAG: helix-turn-helix domain-containing protein [Candidatus Binatia bacterium]
MRPAGTALELERRRRRAIRLLDGGHSLARTAERVGASISAVWRWRQAARRHGPAGLAAKPIPGRPPKLTTQQRERLPRVLARGARAHGFPNDRWTTRRVAVVIKREFGVAYHPAHVSRLLAACLPRGVKPARRAVVHDGAVIAQRKRSRSTAVTKKRGA